jgi:hypothetical protein
MGIGSAMPSLLDSIRFEGKRDDAMDPCLDIPLIRGIPHHVGLLGTMAWIQVDRWPKHTSRYWIRGMHACIHGD